jgi:alanyl-tRNA synthetase
VTERLYYTDPYLTEFDARVVDLRDVAGRSGVVLDCTAFYPTSGGQPFDTGTIGGARVVDVVDGDDGVIVHIVEGVVEVSAPAAGDSGKGILSGRVDWARRFDHMQQHTGQHVLSAAFERVMDAATLSSHLGEERSSIELAVGDTDWRAIERIEEAANRIVWEDRPIERHWVDDEGVKRFKLRKPPAVSGRIRIVEIPDWDVSACGGTHTRRTGEVGAIKIVRWEKVRGNTRFEFLCGARALRDHAWRTEALLEAAKRRTLKDRELIAHLEKAAAERDELAKRLRELTARAVAAEAKERVGSPPRAVSEFFPDRPRDELRTLVLKCLEAGAPWVAAGAGAPEPAVLVARQKGAGVDLKALLPELLARAEGKGGGAPDFLQIAAADARRAEEAWRWATAAVGKP